MKGWYALLGFLVGIVFLWNCGSQAGGNAEVKRYDFNFPIPFSPRKYTIVYSPVSPIIDGKPDDAVWRKAEWSEDFVDIEGSLRPKPDRRTRMKLAYDDNYFYVFGELEEDHIWAKLKQRDTVVYYDDDFEVFIDPDGDGHFYTEIEVNAYNTVWDLMLVHPYRVGDADKVLWKWDLPALKTAVHIRGSLNDPSDRDTSWSVEMAIPLNALNEFAGDQRAGPGKIWRINFSRVDWVVDASNGRYEKGRDEDGKTLPERNWVWSPQGQVAMHMPEMWGYARFGDKENASSTDKANRQALEGSDALSSGQLGEDWYAGPDEAQKMELWRLYFQLANYYQESGRYPSDLKGFTYETTTLCYPPIVLESTRHTYELSMPSCDPNGGNLVLNHEGRLRYRRD